MSDINIAMLMSDINIKNMGIFDKPITKYQLRDALKGSSFRNFSGDKKTRLEEDLFIKKHGASVSERELNQRISDLIKERRQAKTRAEGLEVNKRIELMEKIKKFN